jgi:hypothetical protein
VACASSVACMAVGMQVGSAGFPVTLGERYSG